MTEKSDGKITVKLSFEWWHIPVERQTPGGSAEWGRCKFLINDDVRQCDYWVVYGDLRHDETAVCPPQNTILISDEPPSLLRYEQSFTDKFATIVSSHRYIKHKNNILSQQGLPWVVEKSYDELSSFDGGNKTRPLSMIFSGKDFTPEYRRRVRLAERLERHFGGRMDVWYGNTKGRFDDKWETLAPYKYHVVLENSVCDDYWSEKLTDAFTAMCYPIYCGCPNVGKYFDGRALSTIAMDRPDEAIETIERVLEEDVYEDSLTAIRAAKDRCLNRYNLFALIANLVERKEAHCPAKTIPREKIFIRKTPHHGVMLFFSLGPFHRKDRGLVRKRRREILKLLRRCDCDIRLLREIYFRAHPLHPLVRLLWIEPRKFCKRAAASIAFRIRKHLSLG